MDLCTDMCMDITMGMRLDMCMDIRTHVMRLRADTAMVVLGRPLH